MGLFARYLPVTCAFDAATSWRDVVRQVRGDVEECGRRQHAFDWSVAAPARSSPFLHATFEFDDLPPAMDAGPVTFTLAGVYACTEPFRIKLSLTRCASRLTAALHYDSLRVPEAEAGRRRRASRPCSSRPSVPRTGR